MGIEGCNLNVLYLPVVYNTFVVTSIGNQDFTTKMAMNTCDPKWNESREFIVQKPSEDDDDNEGKVVLFQVYNDRKSPEVAQLIGEHEYEIKKEDNGKEIELNVGKNGARIKVKVDCEGL